MYGLMMADQGQDQKLTRMILQGLRPTACVNHVQVRFYFEPVPITEAALAFALAHCDAHAGAGVAYHDPVSLSGRLSVLVCCAAHAGAGVA
jgi:hypothetical protein